MFVPTGCRFAEAGEVAITDNPDAMIKTAVAIEINFLNIDFFHYLLNTSHNDAGLRICASINGRKIQNQKIKTLKTEGNPSLSSKKKARSPSI
jgi:hypothetical protein